MDSSSFDFLSKSAHRRVRKLLARSYLNEMRAAEALAVYLGVLRDDPRDAEALIVLGNLYQLAGSPRTAGRLYHSALEAQADHPAARQQATLTETLPDTDWEETAPLSAEAACRLAARLEQAAAAGRVDDLRAAADFLDAAPPEARQPGPASANLDGIQQLMPALVALNIRQARAAGHSELADALQSLQITLVRQVDDRWPDLLREEALPDADNPYSPG